MLIYQNSAREFIRDVRENRLTDLLDQRFYELSGQRVTRSELSSWQNSLPRVRDLLEIAGLQDNVIALEYECPYNQSRIDCLLFGKGEASEQNIILLELKQWTKVVPMEEEGNFEEEYEVETFIGAQNRIVAHPSRQVKGYEGYLKSFLTEFENKPDLNLHSYPYCHNYSKTDGDGLFAPIYEKLIRDYPVFTRDDTRALAEKLRILLSGEMAQETFNRFIQSRIRPAKRLLESVAKIIKNETVFYLIKEQLTAKNLIWGKVRKAQKNGKKSVIIVHGGPGTGKSLIAINVLAEAAQRHFNVFYGCKSKPFTNGLQKLVAGDGSMLFSNLYRFLPSKVKENELDLLLVDEAHRVEKTSNHQYTKTPDRTDMPQIDQLIRCAKTSVFFIDDKQSVRSQEIGSSRLIREAAAKFDIPVSEITLETQFRCMGSNNYLKWLESTLGYDDSSRILKKNEVFEFSIEDSPEALYEKLAAHEQKKQNSARIVAGFCWPWSDPTPDGNLIRDVVIGDFSMPWEAKDGFKVARGIPKWYEWAIKPGGFGQIGCIYTAQGFDFDYVGVIIGDDLVYNPKTQRLEGNIKATCDPMLKKYPATFETHMKNIYWTLLTRAMKGCYVYFTNKETEKYFRARIEL